MGESDSCAAVGVAKENPVRPHREMKHLEDVLLHGEDLVLGEHAVPVRPIFL
jgi:hypothetical protein